MTESTNIKANLRRICPGCLLWGLVLAMSSFPKSWAQNPTQSAVIQTLRKEVNRNPTSALSHYRLGVALYRGGVVTEAQREFEAAVKLDPRLAEARNNLGVILREKRDLPRSGPAVPRGSPNKTGLSGSAIQPRARFAGYSRP